MKTPKVISLCISAALMLAGCAQFETNSGESPAKAEEAKTLAQVEQARADLRQETQQFQSAAAKFFQQAGDAYFIVSYEYSHLADEAKKHGGAADVDLLAARAKLYMDFSRDLQENARELAQKQAQQQGARASEPAPLQESPPVAIGSIPNPAIPSAPPQTVSPPPNPAISGIVAPPPMIGNSPMTGMSGSR